MNGAFHPKSDVDGLFVTTEDGGRGLITCGGGGGWEVKKTVWGGMWGILWTFYCKGLGTAEIIKSEKTVSKDEFKTSWNNEKLDSLKGKRLHGHFFRELPETTHVRETWSWLRKSTYLWRPGTGSQDQLWNECHIDKTAESPLCRLCAEKGESVNRIVFQREKGI